jgi:hypothetical protein
MLMWLQPYSSLDFIVTIKVVRSVRILICSAAVLNYTALWSVWGELCTNIRLTRRDLSCESRLWTNVSSLISSWGSWATIIPNFLQYFVLSLVSRDNRPRFDLIAEIPYTSQRPSPCLHLIYAVDRVRTNYFWCNIFQALWTAQTPKSLWVCALCCSSKYTNKKN